MIYYELIGHGLLLHLVHSFGMFLQALFRTLPLVADVALKGFARQFVAAGIAVSLSRCDCPVYFITRRHRFHGRLVFC